jgi:hypothetical protein
MNRELPVYFLVALLIHGTILWAWTRTQPALIDNQEPPAVEIEIAEEQHPAAPIDTVKEEFQRKAPPLLKPPLHPPRLLRARRLDPERIDPMHRGSTASPPPILPLRWLLVNSAASWSPCRLTPSGKPRLQR